MSTFRVAALITVSGILAITSCSLNPLSSSSKPTTDEQEVSVSAENVGDLTFQSINETKTAEALLTMDNPAPENIFEQSAIPSLSAGLPKGLAKKNDGGFSIDTINGLIRVTTVLDGLLQTRYDTLMIVLDETVYDTIEGNESITSLNGAIEYTNGSTCYYSIQDLDGDDIINGSSSPQTATLQIKTVYTKNVIGHVAGENILLTFEVGAGEDNEFGDDDNNTAAQEDNLFFSASWIKTVNDDTVAYAYFTDADGDGVIAETGEGTIDVVFFEKDNPLKLFVDYGKASLRIERDSEGNERTVRFNAEEKLITGRLNRVWVVDESGDSTISADEIAHVHFATNSPAVADSEITAQSEFVIDVGSNLIDVTDNELIEINLAKSFRLGVLDSLDFSCTFDPPLPHGAEPTSGSFALLAFYKDGTTASLVGTFDEGAINATYTDQEGKVTEVELEGESQS